MKSIFHALSVALTAAAQSGGGLRIIDLFGSAPLPRDVAIELVVTTNGVAPGDSKTLTANYALAGQNGLSVAQVSQAAAQQVCALPNAVTTTRTYTLPTIVCGQRYLYLWFDNDELTADAALTVAPRINGGS